MSRGGPKKFDDLSQAEKEEAISRHLVRDLSTLPEDVQRQIAARNSDYVKEVVAREALEAG